MGRGRGSDSVLDLLAAVSKGKATITLEGRPFIHLDADEKTLEVDANGFTAAGLRLQDFGGGKEGPLATLAGPVHVASALSDQGWKLTLCAEGEKVLTMGKGVSRLTGRIRMNPIKARKLLKALR